MLRYSVQQTDSGARIKVPKQGHRNGIVNTQKRCSLPLSTLGRIYCDVCHAMAQEIQRQRYIFLDDKHFDIHLFNKSKLFQNEKDYDISPCGNFYKFVVFRM